MAGKREEWRVGLDPTRVLAPNGDGTWRCVAECAGGVDRRRDEAEARQIVREHNMHERMLDACRLGQEWLCGGCPEINKGPCREPSGVRPPNNTPLAKPGECGEAIPGNALREIIAEAEKGD